jgi:hypothetical protein
MYAETGSDPKRRYTVDEIAGTFAVSRKTIYRHLDKNHAQRQPDKSTRPRPVTRPGDSGATSAAITPAAAGTAVARGRPQRQRSGLAPAALACPGCGHQPASRPEALRQREDLAIVWLRQDSPSGPFSQHRHCASTSNAAPLNARTAATALSAPAPSPVSSASTIRTSPRRSAPGSPATDGNSNPNRYVPPTAVASRTDSGSCTSPRHRPACSAPEAGPGFREDELAGGGQVWPCSTGSLLLWMRAT